MSQHALCERSRNALWEQYGRTSHPRPCTTGPHGVCHLLHSGGVGLVVGKRTAFVDLYHIFEVLAWLGSAVRHSCAEPFVITIDREWVTFSI